VLLSTARNSANPAMLMITMTISVMNKTKPFCLDEVLI
jgi:hypothetical protein